MGDYYQMTISDWLASKTEEIRQELGKTAQSFVAIGYKLKEVRDSGNLADGETIADYAQREFGLSASTTSRFIAINEKFGNGLELKSEYLQFGSGKLQEMLALTDADCELINHNHTVSQIREVKRFEAEKHEDIPSEPVQQHGAFEKCIIDYFKDKKKLLTEICEADYCETDDYKRVADLISPNGSATHKKGVVFLFMYTFDDGIKYKIFGEQSARQMSYIEFINTIRDIFTCEEGVNPHEAFYGVEKELETVEKSTNIPVATSQVEEVTENVSEEDENKNIVSETEDEAETDGDNREHIVEAGEQATVQGIQDRPEEKNDNDSYDSEEVEDEANDGNPGEDDYSDETEDVNEVEHVEVAAVEDIAEAEAETLANDIDMDTDPRHELIDSLEYYCKELVEASKWPTCRASAYRDRSDELIDLILSTRKDILMMNFKIESEKEEDEGE